jgi:hypothetical protein
MRLVKFLKHSRLLRPYRSNASIGLVLKLTLRGHVTANSQHVPPE